MSSTDSKRHAPSAIDRWLLVRYKKYPNAEAIPNTVSSITMRRIHDKARVHFSLLMMAVAGLGMFSFAVMGKRQANSGDSMEKRLHDQQMAYNKRKEEELSNK